MGERFSGLDRAITALTGIMILVVAGMSGFLTYVFRDSSLQLSVSEWAMLYLGVTFDVLTLFAYTSFLRLQREQYRDTISQKNHLTLIAPSQPEPQLALTGGETLVLRCRPTIKGCWLNVLAWLVVIYGTFYSASEADKNLVADIIALPAKAPFIHVIIALMLAPCLFFTYAFTFSKLLARRQTIAIDDRGITLQRRWRREQSMAWEDIQGIYRTGAEGKDIIYSTIHLCAHKRCMQFIILRHHNFIANAERLSPADPVTYSDGGHRLLATIVARTHLSICIEKRASDPIATLTTADIAALPAATSLRQPTTSALTEARVNQEEVVLRERIAWGKYWRDASILAVATASIIGVPLAFYWLQGGSLLHRQIVYYNPILVVGIIILLAFLFLISLAVTYLRNWSENLGIVANRQSITRPRSQKAIPWADIRAWAIYAPKQESSAAVEYILFTTQQTLRWTERPDAQLAGRSVQGDRRDAYRERAAQLHAMIAAHTRLPLREIPTS